MVISGAGFAAFVPVDSVLTLIALLAFFYVKSVRTLDEYAFILNDITYFFK